MISQPSRPSKKSIQTGMTSIKNQPKIKKDQHNAGLDCLTTVFPYLTWRNGYSDGLLPLSRSCAPNRVFNDGTSSIQTD